MNPVPATKPQPVLVLGSVLASLTALISALAIILKDNETAVLVVGIAGAVVAAAGVGLTKYTQGQTVPFVDTAAYVNEDRVLVAGPAYDSPASSADKVAVVVNPNDHPLG